MHIATVYAVLYVDILSPVWDIRIDEDLVTSAGGHTEHIHYLLPVNFLDLLEELVKFPHLGYAILHQSSQYLCYQISHTPTQRMQANNLSQ